MLTVSTVAYLFAAEWAPEPDSQWKLGVPGGVVDGFGLGAGLLSVAIWSLQREGLVALEQLRPVADEPELKLGGRSFVRMTALDVGAASPPGVEGALLAAARDRQRQGLGARLSRIGARFIDRLSGEDEFGVRGAVLALKLHERHPWTTVADLCLAELRDAGLGKLDGQKTILNPLGIEDNRERWRQLAEERERDRAAAPGLALAVHRDCNAAVRWAFGSPD